MALPTTRWYTTPEGEVVNDGDATRITEISDTRITEAGDTRITEDNTVTVPARTVWVQNQGT